MFKIIRKKLLLSFLTLIFAFIIAIPALAATLDVKRVRQAKTRWC